MDVKVFDAEAPISESDLAAVEERLGIQLPRPYRHWLLKYNGGRPSPGGFRYKHETGPYTDGWLTWFLAIHKGPYNNFELEFHRMKLHRKRLPPELVPIAEEGAGNMLCIAVCGPNLGKIYCWDHEEETEPPSYANCHLVADDFDELIASLHETPYDSGQA